MNRESDLPHFLLVIYNTCSAFETSAYTEAGACQALIIDQAEEMRWNSLSHHIRICFYRIPHELDSRRHSRQLNVSFPLQSAQPIITSCSWVPHPPLPQHTPSWPLIIRSHTPRRIRTTMGWMKCMISRMMSSTELVSANSAEGVGAIWSAEHVHRRASMRHHKIAQLRGTDTGNMDVIVGLPIPTSLYKGAGEHLLSCCISSS